MLYVRNAIDCGSRVARVRNRKPPLLLAYRTANSRRSSISSSTHKVGTLSAKQPMPMEVWTTRERSGELKMRMKRKMLRTRTRARSRQRTTRPCPGIALRRRERTYPSMWRHSKLFANGIVYPRTSYRTSRSMATKDRPEYNRMAYLYSWRYV